MPGTQNSMLVYSSSTSLAKRFKMYLERISRLILFSSSKPELEQESSQDSTEDDQSNYACHDSTEVFNSTVSLPPAVFYPSYNNATSSLPVSRLESCSIPFEPNEKIKERPYITINPYTETAVSSIRIKLNSEGRKILTRRQSSSDGVSSDFTPPSPTRKIKDCYGVGNDSIPDLNVPLAPQKFEPIIDSFDVIPQVYLFSNSINTHFRPIDTRRKLSRKRGTIRHVAVEK